MIMRGSINKNHQNCSIPFYNISTNIAGNIQSTKTWMVKNHQNNFLCLNNAMGTQNKSKLLKSLLTHVRVKQ